MKAWVIKWNWIGDHAEVDQPILAILSARTSASKIREYVEILYKTKNYVLREQLKQARYNNPQPNPYPAAFDGNWAGSITCGHNPYLEAFLAEDIVANSDDENKEELSYQRITLENLKRH